MRLNCYLSKEISESSFTPSVFVNEELNCSFLHLCPQLGCYFQSEFDFSSAYFSCLQNSLDYYHYLTTEATKTLICAFVLSRIDYCSFLLAGISKYIFDKLQRIQNNADHLICKPSRCEHILPGIAFFTGCQSWIV